MIRHDALSCASHPTDLAHFGDVAGHILRGGENCQTAAARGVGGVFPSTAVKS